MLYDFWASRRQFRLPLSDWFNFRIGSCLSSATGPCCLSHDLDSGGRNVEFSLMPSQVKGAGLNTHHTSVSTGSCPAGVQGFESPPPHQHFLLKSRLTRFFNGNFILDWNGSVWGVHLPGNYGLFSGKPASTSPMGK